MNTENVPGMCFDQSHVRPCNHRKQMDSQSRNQVGPQVVWKLRRQGLISIFIL